MARKGWDSLSSTYRERLSRAGISKADYESGESIKEARGHEKTPERPKGFDAKEFPDYKREQNKLIQQVENKKQMIWGAAPKWNPKKSAKALHDNPPPLRLLRWALQATEEEIRDAIRENPEIFWFLGYH